MTKDYLFCTKIIVEPSFETEMNLTSEKSLIVWIQTRDLIIFILAYFQQCGRNFLTISLCCSEWFMNHLLAIHTYSVIEVLMYTRVSHVINTRLWDINIQLLQKVVQGLHDSFGLQKEVHSQSNGRKIDRLDKEYLRCLTVRPQGAAAQIVSLQISDSLSYSITKQIFHVSGR